MKSNSPDGGIAFIKYGGLKFLEAAHVKDLLCVLRWVETPRDAIAAFRVLQLLPGIGPATAREATDHLSGTGWDFAALDGFRATRRRRAALAGARACAPGATPWTGQMALARRWYQRHLERLYDNPVARTGDLDQLEQIAPGPIRTGAAS